MFLMSDAFRAARENGARPWHWPTTSVLMISHAWNPAADSAEALAGRRLARALLDAGAFVHVLCASAADVEFGHPNYRTSVVPQRRFPTHKLRRAAAMMRSTIPEAEGAWVSDAVAAGREILSSMPGGTIVYGRSLPGASNVVAWHLARARTRPWVAHFSDEWPARHVLSNGRRWSAPYKEPLFGLWRRRIIRDAGALTFTNPRQGEELLGADGDYAHKAFVVAHLASQPTTREVPLRYDRFHIVHTGNFYPNEHTAAALMQGLALFLERRPAARLTVRFTQAGWANGDVPEWTARCGLADVVDITGRLSQPAIAALLDGASLLVAVDYARLDSRTVLSKLPDYVNARRPILAITGPRSALARLFVSDGGGLTAGFDSPEEVAERIEEVYDAWLNQRLTALLPGATAVESFSPGRVLAELGAAFAAARGAASPATSHHLFEPGEGNVAT